MFDWLKENCRIETRFDKLAKSYRHDIAGLLYAVFAISLFVKTLGLT